ncbi:hypothetical protein TcBrA4_0062300 [Trypanosoma cruzi]|nr:hypothetical protein TcBrA4_0062300 [Trypanosoma cruzi]
MILTLLPLMLDRDTRSSGSEVTFAVASCFLLNAELPSQRQALQLPREAYTLVFAEVVLLGQEARFCRDSGTWEAREHLEKRDDPC